MSNDYGTGPHPAQFATTPPSNSRKRLYALIAAGVVVVVAAAVVIWAVKGDSGPAEPAANSETSAQPEVITVVLEQAGAEAENPFTSSVAVTPVVEFPDAVVQVIQNQAKQLLSDPLSGGLAASGVAPGLYGGSGESMVCNVAELGTYLSANGDKAAAWAQALEIPVDTISQFLQNLTPLVLLHDTAVTNFGFENGAPVPFQAILQAGTAVLVDPSGLPVVRCACGNPLAAPEPLDLDAVEFDGERWPDFAPPKVVTVSGSDAAVDTFTIVDVVTGELYERNVGAIAEEATTPGLLVAVGEKISTSPDGVEWTTVENSPAASRIAYGDGLLVAVAAEGEYPEQSTLVYTSTDGATWSEPQTLPGPPADIAYADGLWAIAGPSQTPPESGITGVIHTSSDGRTWQAKPVSIPADNWDVPLDINSLSVSGGAWMLEALSYLGDSEIQTVLRSTDQGQTWTVVPYQNPTTGSTFFPLGLQWGWDGKSLVAVGSELVEVRLDGPSVYSSQAGNSSDGLQWTFAATSPPEAAFSSLTFDADRGWIAAGRVGDFATGTHSVYGSSDLYNWTLLGAPDGKVNDVAVMPGELPADYEPPVTGPAPSAEPPPSATPAPSAAPVPSPEEAGSCLYTSPDGRQSELRAITVGNPPCTLMTEIMEAIGRGDTTPTGPRSVQLANGWSCAFAPITSTEETGVAGSCSPDDGSNAGFEMVVAGAIAPVPSAAPPAGSGVVDGDLALSIPMTRPSCDGTGIVLLGAATTPGSYESDVQNLLNAHPGASYLRTDQSCLSLNQATSSGNPIYAVYIVAGYDEASVRSAVCSAGGPAYGKWLDNSTDPNFQINC